MITECPGCQARYDVSGRAPGTRARCRCGTHFTLPQPKETAGALACPSCGAASDPTRTTCTYCSARLLLVTCPACFGSLYTGSKHCPHCGVRADSSARSGEDLERVRQCPRCDSKSPLVAALVGGVMLDQCENCTGTFIDRVTLDKLVADRDKQSLVHAALARDPDLQLEERAPGNPTASVKYLKCPDCANLMSRKNFGRISGVIVDVCPPHGTWFDSEELRRVVEFVQQGGLVKARQLEVDTVKRQLEEKRNRYQSSPASSWEARYDNTKAEMVLEGFVEAALQIFLRWR